MTNFSGVANLGFHDCLHLSELMQVVLQELDSHVMAHLQKSGEISISDRCDGCTRLTGVHFACPREGKPGKRLLTYCSRFDSKCSSGSALSGEPVEAIVPLFRRPGSSLPVPSGSSAFFLSTLLKPSRGRVRE